VCQCHSVIVLLYHNVTMLQYTVLCCHTIIMLQCYNVAIIQYNVVTLSQCYSFTVSKYLCDIVILFHCWHHDKEILSIFIVLWCFLWQWVVQLFDCMTIWEYVTDVGMKSEVFWLLEVWRMVSGVGQIPRT